MKKWSIGLNLGLALALAVPSAWAGDKKGQKNVKIAAGGTVTAAGTGGTIYGFVRASNIRRDETRVIFPETPAGHRPDAQAIAEKTKEMQAGDKVSVTYHLNEAKNRLKAVEQLEDEADNAVSSAGFSGMLAAEDGLSALKDAFQGNLEGAISNVGGAIFWGSDAAGEIQRSKRTAQKANQVAGGAPVDYIDQFSTYRGGQSEGAVIAEVLDGIVKDGGKIVSVEHLKKIPLQKAGKLDALGGVSVGVGVIGLVYTGYQALSVDNDYLGAATSDLRQKTLPAVQLADNGPTPTTTSKASPQPSQVSGTL